MASGSERKRRLSILHSKLTWASSAPKRKVGVASHDLFGGLRRRLVCGAPLLLPEPADGPPDPPVAPPPALTQSCSLGATEFGRGAGNAGEKSAALSSLSSLLWSWVGQPGVMVRRSAMPSGMAPAGEPAGLGRDPLKLPQETDSIDSQQTAPPAGSSFPPASAESGAETELRLGFGRLASTIVLWLVSLARSLGKALAEVAAPLAS